MIGRRFLFGLLAATPLVPAAAKPAAAMPMPPASIWHVSWQPPAAVMDLLSQRDEALEDKLWIEGNLPVRRGRASIPADKWREINRDADKP